MKRLFILLFFIFMMLPISACSPNEGKKFDESKIQLNVTHQYNNEYFVGYVIDVTNNTKVAISYLDMYLSFPTTIKKGSNNSGFVLVGVPHKKDVHIKSGEMVEFTFEGFLEVLNTNYIDIENPEIVLKGYIEEEPFEISGHINVVSSDSR